MERRHCILSDYVERALEAAIYEKLDDASYAGKISGCAGVLAFAESLRKCEAELRSTLEGRILVGLKFGQELPVLDGIDLNREPALESVNAA